MPTVVASSAVKPPSAWSVAVDPDLPAFVSPPGYQKRNDHRLLTPYSLPMEHEMNRRRLDAALALFIAFIKQVVVGHEGPRLTTGKECS